jgi:hypothetical protein
VALGKNIVSLPAFVARKSSQYSAMDEVVNPIASEHRNLWRKADKVLTFAH